MFGMKVREAINQEVKSRVIIPQLGKNGLFYEETFAAFLKFPGQVMKQRPARWTRAPGTLIRGFRPLTCAKEEKKKR